MSCLRDVESSFEVYCIDLRIGLIGPSLFLKCRRFKEPVVSEFLLVKLRSCVLEIVGRLKCIANLNRKCGNFWRSTVSHLYMFNKVYIDLLNHIVLRRYQLVCCRVEGNRNHCIVVV